jgi:GntR family transcriptional regulator
MSETVSVGLDRSSPMPLWAQLESELRRRLVRGDFDDAFPTEIQLVEAYDVSRHTVRDALGRLRADGLLDRRRGRGTRVTKRALEQPMHSLYSLARTIEDQGLDERSDVLVLEAGTDPVAAARLGRPERARLVRVDRLRYAGDEPLALDRSWLPADAARGLLGADLHRGSLYDALSTRCGVHVTGGTERIRPVVPTRDERSLLHLPAGEAALLIDRVADADGAPVEWRRTLVRGDRYAFTARWG